MVRKTSVVECPTSYECSVWACHGDAPAERMIRQSLAMWVGSGILQGCLLVWATLLAQNKAKGRGCRRGNRRGGRRRRGHLCYSMVFVVVVVV